MVLFISSQKVVRSIATNTLVPSLAPENFPTNNGIVDTKQSHWFEEYFQNNIYDIKNYCSLCSEGSLLKMHLQSWQNLKDSFEANDKDIDIVNCTKGSALTCFRTSTLEKELG